MNNENEKILKIKKASHTTAKVINVFKWIMIVADILLIAGIITLLVKKNEVNEEMAKSIAAGEGRYEFVSKVKIGFVELNDSFEAEVASGNYVGYIVKYMVAAVVAVAIATFVMFELEDIFKFIEKNDTPFKTEILRKIVYTGVSLAIIALSESIAMAAIIALVTWCIYNVVDYGCVLQSDYDETL